MYYYVDVQNEKENDYDLNNQHIIIDPEFHAHIHEENEQNISNFLSLPEIIPTKKISMQQPLLDYTNSKILISKYYIIGLEELLARKKKPHLQLQRKRKKTRRPLKSNGRMRKNNNKNSRRSAHNNEQGKNKRRRRIFLLEEFYEQLGAVGREWSHRNLCMPSQQNPGRFSSVFKHLMHGDPPHYHTHGCTHLMQIPTPMSSTHQHTNSTPRRTPMSLRRKLRKNREFV